MNALIEIGGKTGIYTCLAIIIFKSITSAAYWLLLVITNALLNG